MLKALQTQLTSGPLADLQAPKVDPATLNSKKVTDLMTADGLL